MKRFHNFHIPRRTDFASFGQIDEQTFSYPIDDDDDVWPYRMENVCKCQQRRLGHISCYNPISNQLIVIHFIINI